MADISKIKTLNGTTYDIKDAKAVHNVYNGLDSTSTNDALSANMGKLLNSNKMNSTIGSSVQNVDILAQAPGAYRYNGNCSNVPSAESGFLGIVERDSITKVATAISSSGRTFSNVMISGTWIGWKELAQNSNLLEYVDVNIGNITIPSSGYLDIRTHKPTKAGKDIAFVQVKNYGSGKGALSIDAQGNYISGNAGEFTTVALRYFFM